MSTVTKRCPQCGRGVGFAAMAELVRVVCPTHGTIGTVARRRLNGDYDRSKIGGSGGDD